MALDSDIDLTEVFRLKVNAAINDKEPLHRIALPGS
jgi:hypothetical protein